VPRLQTSPLTRDQPGEPVQLGQHLVGGHHSGAERGGEVLRSGHAEPTLGHFAVLQVAGGDVVEDHEAADRSERLLGSDVAQGLGQHDCDLELVVECLGVGRPAQQLAVGDDGQRVAPVVDRLLVPQRTRAQPRKNSSGDPFVAGDQPGQSRRRQPEHAAGGVDHVPLPQRAVSKGDWRERKTRRRLHHAEVLVANRVQHAVGLGAQGGAAAEEEQHVVGRREQLAGRSASALQPLPNRRTQRHQPTVALDPDGGPVLSRVGALG